MGIGVLRLEIKEYGLVMKVRLGKGASMECIVGPEAR
jgi:hypothetical protein